jgi:sec-independent protein translocase protein TatB
MFGIGISELAIIFLVALLVLGPDQLPKVARKLAQLVGEFRSFNDDLRLNLMSASNDIIPTQDKTPSNVVPRSQILVQDSSPALAKSDEGSLIQEGSSMHG